MPDTFPATWPEPEVGRRGEIALPAAGDPQAGYAPNFALLDTGGPRPWALLLAFGFSSGLLLLAIVVARFRPLNLPLETESITEVYIPYERLFLPKKPALLNSRPSATPISGSPDPASNSPAVSASNAPADAGAQADPPATVSPSLGPSAPPVRSTGDDSLARNMPPAAPAATPGAEGDIPKPAPEALAAVPLPRLIEHEASLAAGLAALTPDQRRTLPRVSIRVNAEWLEALPQTQEKLYFSVAKPQADSEVLAYVPASRNFALERPLLPLWQILDSQQVPELAALLSDAAGRLGVLPELVGLYTWHPPVFENALRMFVLERMEQMGMPMGPGDLVTVRLATGPAGWVMNLEPLRGAGSQ